MNFAKTSFYAAIATTARLLSQFVVAKVIAVFGGATVFGVFGQFQSFISLTQLGSGSLVSTGVTKYVSEYHEDPVKLSRIIYTAIQFCIVSSFLTGLLIAAFAHLISQWLFKSTEYTWVIVVFGLTLFGYSLNQLFMSILNGLNEMKKYTMMAVVGAITSVVLIGGLTYIDNVKGAMFGLVLSQLCLFLVGILFIQKLPIMLRFSRVRFYKEELKKLCHFSIMPIVSVLCLPLAQIFLRSYVAGHSSWADVGYWQGVLKISDAYLMVLTTIINTYALPKYSKTTSDMALKNEVWVFLVKIMPIVTFFSLSIFLLKDEIILVLFSSKFLPMRPLFFYQLIGDVLKIASWCIANVFLAKAKVLVFSILEISFTVSYVVLSLAGFHYFGIRGLTMAFAANYLFYLLAVFVWFLQMSNYSLKKVVS
jgi:PST family polysaccharide transporter